MRIGYFDCFAGVSGDMILGCLFDLGFRKEDLLHELSQLGTGDVGIDVSDVMRNGVRAKRMSVRYQKDQVSRTLKDIIELIDNSRLSPLVRERSARAFDLLADAESRVHGTRKDQVHFHEVGALDSLVDVIGAFIGLDHLGIERIVASPLALGTGSVECQHGVLPVPAPATLELARGLPVRGWGVPGEMTTPTGAAILKTCGSDFGPIPHMRVTGVGYGAGSRDLDEIPNVMRLIVGEARTYGFDQVTLVETNIDDMNPQFFSHLYGDLFSAGALDVWVAQVLMKKGRPGFVLSVLAERPGVPGVVDVILSETTASGVRLAEVDRVKLARRAVELDTKYGNVRVKLFTLDSKRRCAPEYEDCLRISRAQGVSIDEVIEEAKNAYRRTFETSS